MVRYLVRKKRRTLDTVRVPKGAQVVRVKGGYQIVKGRRRSVKFRGYRYFR